MNARPPLKPAGVADQQAIRAVFFDFGGVLSPPLEELFDLYERKTDVPGTALRRAMAAVGRDLGASPLHHIELGQISQHEWGTRLRRRLREDGVDAASADLENFGDQWFAGVLANHEMAASIDLTRELGLLVGVMSNNVVEWEPHWHRIIEPLGPFDIVLDSCRVGTRKPEPEIFDLAESAVGAGPESCLLIDDLEENCRAARERGWSAIRFRDNAQADSELRSILRAPAGRSPHHPTSVPIPS